MFYQQIDSPIETVKGAGTDNNLSFTFVNGESADLYGVEVDWLKDLGFDLPGGGHSAVVVYNSYSERLFHSLDFIYTWYPAERWSLRVRLQNLLDEKVEIDQGGAIRIR